MEKLKFINAENTPNIRTQYSSAPLVIRNKGGDLEFGFYNIHESYEQSGYYKTPNFDQRIDASDYAVAPPNTIVECENCNETSLVKELVGSPFIERIKAQSFPCCPECNDCLRFTFVGYEEEKQ